MIDALYYRALRLSGSEGDAWDLVQDALERGLRRFRGSWSSTDAARWLRVVLKHLHFDRVRSGAWRSLARVDPNALDYLVSPEPVPLPLWRQVDPEVVRLGLGKLRAADRQILAMRSERALSLKDIGKVLGIKPVTAGTRLYRARKCLVAALGLGAGGCNQPARGSRCSSRALTRSQTRD